RIGRSLAALAHEHIIKFFAKTRKFALRVDQDHLHFSKELLRQQANQPTLPFAWPIATFTQHSPSPPPRGIPKGRSRDCRAGASPPGTPHIAICADASSPR